MIPSSGKGLCFMIHDNVAEGQVNIRKKERQKLG